MLNTVEITKPELPSPLPTDHDGLMSAFYDYWQTLSAKVREHNAALDPRCDDIFVNPKIEGMLRSPHQDEIAAVMPPKVNAAVILGNYNYQVGNGGHLQWADNGYAASADALRNLLDGATKIGIAGAKDMLDIVDEFQKRAAEAERGSSEARRFGSMFSNDDEEDDEFSGDIYGDLDTRLYALDTETIMQAVLDRFDEAVAHAFMAGAYRKAA